MVHARVQISDEKVSGFVDSNRATGGLIKRGVCDSNISSRVGENVWPKSERRILASGSVTFSLDSPSQIGTTSCFGTPGESVWPSNRLTGSRSGSPYSS